MLTSFEGRQFSYLLQGKHKARRPPSEVYVYKQLFVIFRAGMATASQVSPAAPFLYALICSRWRFTTNSLKIGALLTSY